MISGKSCRLFVALATTSNAASFHFTPFLLYHHDYQSSKRARSGRKQEKARSPGWGVVLSRDGQSANSVKSTRKYHRFHYGNGRRNIFLLAVFLNPRPPPELPPGLPAPRRRSWRRRGGHCVASATLPFYLGSWKRGPNNLESATIRFVSDLLRAAPPDLLCYGAGQGERESGGRGTETCWGTSDFPGPRPTEFGFEVDGRLHNSDKKFALTLGAEAEGRGQGWGEVQGAERGRGATSPAMPEWIHKDFLKTQMRKKIYIKHREWRKIL